jgi:ubiquinone/menaquinone biosynthesis C-methylase UbiE
VDHSDHVSLLRAGIPTPTPAAVWADIGAGEGAFTLALADLLGPGASVIAVDRDGRALAANAARVGASFPGTMLSRLTADFRQPLALPALDGLVAANSLHFVPRHDQASSSRRSPRT